MALKSRGQPIPQRTNNSQQRRHARESEVLGRLLSSFTELLTGIARKLRPPLHPSSRGAALLLYVSGEAERDTFPATILHQTEI